jgi:hypothetical protein
VKKHILRAPQTDRYLLQVPTKLSELEDDLPVSPRFIGASSVTLTAPGPDGPKAFPMANTALSDSTGFATPVGNLDIVIPQTGLYLISCVFTWNSTTTSGGGVGRLTTPGTFQVLTTFAGSVLGALDGTYLRDNKLGPLTTNPGDLAVSVAVSLLGALTVGDIISPQAAAVAIAGGLNAVINFSIVRVA